MIRTPRSKRNPFYREKAIAIHGLVCMACEMDFEAKYGSWAPASSTCITTSPFPSRGQQGSIQRQT